MTSKIVGFIFSSAFLLVAMVQPSLPTSPKLEKICDNIRGLTPYQRKVCVEHSDVMVAFGRGSLELLHQCQRPDGLFQFEAWNCSQGIQKWNAYNYWIQGATAEAAFLVSLKAAGFVLGYARACETGNLSFCSCARAGAWRQSLVKKEPAPVPMPTELLWNAQGCGEVINEATEEARKFLKNSGPQGRNRWNLVTDAHNHGVGLKVPLTLVKKKCRCHGISASCTQQTCFTDIPSTFEILVRLKQQYKAARQVIPRRRLARLPHGAPPRGSRGVVPLVGPAPLTESDLIFRQPSPDYCTVQSPFGRTCAALEYGSGKRVQHCNNLCCGRGFVSREETFLENCQCTFEWCCRVNCKRCERNYRMSYCK